MRGRVAHAGVGGWGKNVVRVVGELADLAWICDTDDGRRAEYAARYPGARTTGSFDDLVGESHDSRILVARIMQRLRAVPEHRCLVPERKRPAA